MTINGVKVFAATMLAERTKLGEAVTTWLTEKRANPEFQLIDTVITQSSDNAFHCVTFTLFYYEPVVIPTGGKRLFR